MKKHLSGCIVWFMVLRWANRPLTSSAWRWFRLSFFRTPFSALHIVLQETMQPGFNVLHFFKIDWIRNSVFILCQCFALQAQKLDPWSVPCKKRKPNINPRTPPDTQNEKTGPIMGACWAFPLAAWKSIPKTVCHHFWPDLMAGAEIEQGSKTKNNSH
jgi:hypothetical protein